jgi:hypothetical protein
MRKSVRCWSKVSAAWWRKHNQNRFDVDFLFACFTCWFVSPKLPFSVVQFLQIFQRVCTDELFPHKKNKNNTVTIY